MLTGSCSFLSFINVNHKCNFISFLGGNATLKRFCDNASAVFNLTLAKYWVFLIGWYLLINTQSFYTPDQFVEVKLKIFSFRTGFVFRAQSEFHIGQLQLKLSESRTGDLGSYPGSVPGQYWDETFCESIQSVGPCRELCSGGSQCRTWPGSHHHCWQYSYWLVTYFVVYI